MSQRWLRLIEWGLYLFVFLLPWQTRLIWHDASVNGSVWEYGRFSLYGTQLVLWTILLLYFVYLLSQLPRQSLRFRQWWAGWRQPSARLYWLIVIFILFTAVSMSWALDFDLALYRWFVLAQAGALMALVTQLPNFSWRFFSVAWVGSAAVQGGFAVYQFFNQQVVANKWLGLASHLPTVSGSIILQTDSERWLRAYGSFPHPNVLAGFLLIGLFLLFYLALNQPRRPERIFILASLLAIIPGLFFTFSRSAWLALVAALLWLGWWVKRRGTAAMRRQFYQVLGLTLLLIVILSFYFSGPLQARLFGGSALEDNSINLRYAYTRQALTIFSQLPWQGTGLGNYTLGVMTLINDQWPGFYYQPVHNIFLLTLAELGIVGGLFFLVIISGLLFALGPKRSLESAVAWLLFLSLMIISLIDHYFWSLEVGVLIFWLMVGLNLRRAERLDAS